MARTPGTRRRPHKLELRSSDIEDVEDVFVAEGRGARPSDPWAGFDVAEDQGNLWADFDVAENQEGLDDPVEQPDPSFGEDDPNKAPSAHERAPGEAADPRSMPQRVGAFLGGDIDALPEMTLTNAIGAGSPTIAHDRPTFAGRDLPTSRTLFRAVESLGAQGAHQAPEVSDLLATAMPTSQHDEPIVGNDPRLGAFAAGNPAAQAMAAGYRVGQELDEMGMLHEDVRPIMDLARRRGIEGRIEQGRRGAEMAPGTYLTGNVVGSLPMMLAAPQSIAGQLGLAFGEGAGFGMLHEGAVGTGESTMADMILGGLAGGIAGGVMAAPFALGGSALRRLGADRAIGAVGEQGVREGGEIAARAARQRILGATGGAEAGLVENVLDQSGPAGQRRLEQFGRDVVEERLHRGMFPNRNAAEDLVDRSTARLENVQRMMAEAEAGSQGAAGRVNMEPVMQALEDAGASASSVAGPESAARQNAIRAMMQQLQDAMDAEARAGMPANTLSFGTARANWNNWGAQMVPTQNTPAGMQRVLRDARRALREQSRVAAERVQYGLGGELDEAMRKYNVGSQIGGAIRRRQMRNMLQRHGVEAGVAAAGAAAASTLEEPDAATYLLAAGGAGLATKLLRGRLRGVEARGLTTILPALRAGGPSLQSAGQILSGAAALGHTFLAQANELLLMTNPEYRAFLGRESERERAAFEEESERHGEH